MLEGNNKVKVSFFGEPEFYVNEKKRTVACRLSGCLCGIGFTNIGICFDKTAVARCSPTDMFDVELGKRIAHAKAENMAYKFAINACKERLAETANLSKNIEKFIGKGLSCRSHNVDYIERLGAEAQELPY